MDDSLDQQLSNFVLQFKNRLDASENHDRQTDYGPKSYTVDDPVASVRQTSSTGQPMPEMKPIKTRRVGAYFTASLPAPPPPPEQPPPVVPQAPLQVIISGYVPPTGFVDINGTYTLQFYPPNLPARTFLYRDANVNIELDFNPLATLNTSVQVDDQTQGGVTVFLGSGTFPGPIPNADPGGGMATVVGSPY